MNDRAVWTEKDVERLIDALKTEHGFWDAYVAGEIREKQIQPQVSQWTRMTMHRLFPSASFEELTDLLILFRDLVRTQLGLER
ncbi:hypothetical protein JQ609_05020 [Bradyrhizobium sp. AUGA SZCCT0169]|jgi:hypothetical protein|uniref:hypothetical protein n=1 Tax=Bradyrhizobium sp. AUGA SZCCT0169 TaxID=2807663 RepID=UPI001BADFFFF|nr:hypothetical protein [Bradyrhizobium sp. AUGA SZCCT0169]MBR1246291.1 hypothetical protein [Bradyrhizobium sp. AUGA SZCCT0169]